MVTFKPEAPFLSDSAWAESTAGVVVAVGPAASAGGTRLQGGGGDEISSSGASAAEGVGTDATDEVGAGRRP